MTAKIYTKRDSITAILRKKGVDKSKYNDFIKKVEGGFQLVEETKPQPKKPKTEATDLVKSLVDNAGKEKPEKKKAKKDVVSVSTFIREMILDNKTNAEIFKACQVAYGADRFNEEKSHYPAWYRCEMRRKKELPEYADPKAKLPKTVKVIVEK